MKKTIILLAILILLCPMILADTLSSAEVDLNLHIPYNLYVEITALAADSNTAVGMPFDLTINAVADGGIGRKIATWSFDANMTSATMTFQADNLLSAEDGTSEIGYVLKFYYSYSNAALSEQSGYVSVTSGDTGTTQTFTNDTFMSSTNQYIYFNLDGEYTWTDLPDGYYYADVTITLTGS